MPRQISGKKCKEIAKRKSTEATAGRMPGILFARVLKPVGQDHFTVAINGKHGPFEVRAGLKKSLRKRGATPLAPNNVVAVFFGNDFDPMSQEDLDSVKTTDHFSIDAILSAKQAYALQERGEIPDWMVQEMKKDDDEKKKEESGFEFEYKKDKDDSDLDDSDVDDI